MKFISHAFDKKAALFLVTVITTSITLSACGGSGSSGTPINAQLTPNGGTAVVAIPTPGPAGPTPTPSRTGGGKNPSGLPSCVTADVNHQCIGMKVVSFSNAGNSVISAPEAQTLTDGINSVWSQCNIAFQLEKYVSVDPATKNLSYNTNWQNDGDTVREAFQEGNSFLLVAVGALGGSTIAVTQMPGYGPFGTLVEAMYATNSLTVGHEFGHYMGLYHINDTSMLMNPYIGTGTSALSVSECQTARNTNLTNWPQMLRN